MGTAGTFFTLISRVRKALHSIDLGNTLKWNIERYVSGFIEAAILFLGTLDAAQHLMARDLPDEAIPFGSKLGTTTLS